MRAPIAQNESFVQLEIGSKHKFHNIVLPLSKSPILLIKPISAILLYDKLYYFL